MLNDANYMIKPDHDLRSINHGPRWYNKLLIILFLGWSSGVQINLQPRGFTKK